MGLLQEDITVAKVSGGGSTTRGLCSAFLVEMKRGYHLVAQWIP